jgi:mRNA interferase RelE/StbE
VAYRILITSAARRQLRRLPAPIHARVAAKIDALADNLRPAGVLKMQANEELYRIRVGDYRIIYEIQHLTMIAALTTVNS